MHDCQSMVIPVATGTGHNRVPVVSRLTLNEPAAQVLKTGCQISPVECRAFPGIITVRGRVRLETHLASRAGGRKVIGGEVPFSHFIIVPDVMPGSLFRVHCDTARVDGTLLDAYTLEQRLELVLHAVLIREQEAPFSPQFRAIS